MVIWAFNPELTKEERTMSYEIHTRPHHVANSTLGGGPENIKVDRDSEGTEPHGRPVNTALGELSKSIDVLGDMISMLTGRLDPVLPAHEPDEVEPSCDMKEVEMGSSDLYRAIQAERRRIEAHGRALADLRGRVEL